MGRYAEIAEPISTWERVNTEMRWWVSRNYRRLRTPRFHPDDDRSGYIHSREFGLWMVRPGKGFRSHRYVTPPLHMARSENALMDWGMANLITS